MVHVERIFVDMSGTYEEKRALEKKAYLLMGASILVGLFRGVFLMISDSLFPLAILALLIGVALWLIGFTVFVRSRGYPDSHGWFGVLGLIGLLIIVMKPDQYEIIHPEEVGLGLNLPPRYDAETPK